jgi:CheY-like chemotaxis protein
MMGSDMPEQSVILLVDDDAVDVQLAQRAFLKATLENPLQTVKSGEEAIAYLIGDGIYADREKYPMPALVLLDLRMPGIHGLDVLRWIRRQADLKELRVVVLTGSESIRDVIEAYAAGANSFMIKPMDFERLAKLGQAFGGCWVWTHSSPKPAADAVTETGNAAAETVQHVVEAARN